MKHVWGLTALALSAFAYSPAVYAAPELKVGYVDIQKALAESRAGSAAKKEYEVEVKQAQGELDKKKESFQAKRAAFDKQKASLSEEAGAQKQEELLQLEKDLKRNFQDLESKLRRRNAQIIGDLVKELRKAVAVVGEERGYTVILERSSDAVLYVDAQHDITAEVVKAYDAQTK